MSEELIEHYRTLLANGPGPAEAVCLTYATGCAEDAIIRAFGGDPSTAEDATIAEAQAWAMSFHYSEVPCFALIGDFGDWWIAVEPNGFQGSRPEVLRGASAAGRALSVYWNVNADNAFNYAVAGRRLLTFDMMFPEDRHGSAPDALEVEISRLPFDDDWCAAGLALAERISGVRLDRTWTSRRYRMVVLQELPEDLVPDGREDDPVLDDPELQQVMADPAQTLPLMLRILAAIVVRDAGIEGLPDVAPALAAVRAGRYGGDLPGRLRTQADRLREESFASPDPQRARDLFRTHHALLALSGAAAGDFAATDGWATYVVDNPADHLRTTVLARCYKRFLAARTRRGVGRRPAS